MTKTSKELLACAKRELYLRKSLYPGMIEPKRFTADQCRHEIECMEQIVEILQAREDLAQPSLFAGQPNP